MDDYETVYEDMSDEHNCYLSLRSSIVSVQPENRKEHVISSYGTEHTEEHTEEPTEEHTANTGRLGNIVGEQTPTTKQRKIRAVLCFLIGLGIGIGVSLATGYYMMSQVKYRPVNRIITFCAAFHTDEPNMESGVYTIYPGDSLRQLDVYCDMSTEGGGWTVIQRRQDGSIQFNRTWAEYKYGFGSAYGELWIGNIALHQLTAQQPCELWVDLDDWEGQHGYAVYSSFRIAKETDNYRLTVGGYSGTAGDSLNDRHNSYQFSTKDRDNDGWSDGSCATPQGGGGGWWYGYCRYSVLNGRY